MKILISAAEASSDAHGAELLKAIREQAQGSVEAFGIGGPRLQKAGLRVIVDARELLAMGFVEILGHLPKIFRALKQVSAEAEAEKPDVAIVIDYPDFHFRLAKRLKQQGIPVVYYIPPKVWAWRKRRVKILRQFFAKILCILPFEEEFYKNHQVAVKYVGNPLVDELPLQLTRDEARFKLGLGKHDRVLVLMPGSRPSELKRHLELMLDAAAMAEKNLRASEFFDHNERLHILIPLPATADRASIEERIQAWPGRNHDGIEIRVSQGDAAECLVAADGGLIKSGTSTLEAGLLRCPHAVIYKPSQSTAWIFKHLIRYRGPVALVNLVAGWKPGDPYLVREILCEHVTVGNLTKEVIQLLADSNYRSQMKIGFEKLRNQVCGTREKIRPSTTAAREILQVVQDVKRTAPELTN
jgi:lipid-A-disaccharide synthase